MSDHQHTEHTSAGPYCCADGTKFTLTCACGATRKICNCRQCREQESSTTAWAMPMCGACKKRHPVDQSCG